MNQGAREGGREGTNNKINQLGINKIRSLKIRIHGKAAYQCLCLTPIAAFQLNNWANFPYPSSPSQRDLGSRLSP